MKPIAVDLPYPSLDGIEMDIRSARIISPAYAAQFSELTAVCQYFYHHLQFKRQEENELATLLEEISVTEMRHLDILGTMLGRLGVNAILTANPPISNNFFSTAYVNYINSPERMLEADIKAEANAIEEYNRMLEKLDNQDVAAVISRIVMDETLHLEALTKALDDYQKRRQD